MKDKAYVEATPSQTLDTATGMNGESSPGTGGTQEKGAHFSQSISIPHRCASCGASAFDEYGACIRCGGVFTEPDLDTLIARVLADECADHAVLVAAVRRCRVMPMNGGVFVAAEDWARVWEAAGRADD